MGHTHRGQTKFGTRHIQTLLQMLHDGLVNLNKPACQCCQLFQITAQHTQQTTTMVMDPPRDHHMGGPPPNEGQPLAIQLVQYRSLPSSYPPRKIGAKL
jgi:hypothetical protein